MSKVPKAGREAGSDSISPNPALTGGIFDSGAVCEAIADAIEADDGPTGEDSAAQDAPPAMNCALSIWGGSAVVINEQPAGPVNDRVRAMSLEALNSWFGNRFTEAVSGAPAIWIFGAASLLSRRPRSRSREGRDRHKTFRDHLLILLGDGDSDPFRRRAGTRQALALACGPDLRVRIRFAAAGLDFNDLLKGSIGS